MASGKILVVDDDHNLLELVKMRLESADYEVTTASREEDALDAVKGQVFDLSIVDLQLAHRDGISLMEELHLVLPEMPVIILTAYGTIESAVEAMKRGAYSYLTKPFDPRDLLFQIERALENRRLTSEVQRLKDLLSERYDFSNIVAKSEKMQKVLEAVAQIAKIDSNGLHPRRKRHRKRADCKGHPSCQREKGQSLCGDQLRRNSGAPAGKQAFRP